MFISLGKRTDRKVESEIIATWSIDNKKKTFKSKKYENDILCKNVIMIATQNRKSIKRQEQYNKEDKNLLK
ncbi:MAG: hypothetical protein QXP60_09355 [Nitrososphaerota archaeon]